MKRHACAWLQESALAVERRHWTSRILVTLASVALAGVAQAEVHARLHDTLYLLFHPANICATWYGGWQMGVIGTGLSLVAAVLIMAPATGADGWHAEYWSLVVFVPVSLFLTWLTNLLRIALVELKHAGDKALKDKEAMDQLYDSISDAFFSVDRDWRFVFVNRKALELKPPEEAALIGRNLWECCGHKITNEGKERLRSAMRDRIPVAFEHHRPDAECWQEVHVYPSDIGLSIFLTDISERKKLEQQLASAHQQLRKYATDLENDVSNRTKRLKEMAAELETFSYSVSHDLRSPVRSMQAYAQTILEQSGPDLEPSARNYLERIERAARRLDQLIQDVLTYEQLVGAHFTVEKVDLNELIRDIINQYPRLTRNQQFIQIDYPLLPVKGNSACLTQCLANLLDNALKFVSPHRPPEVRVLTNRAGNNVHLAIEDSGIGISADRMKHIFEVFQRGHTGFEGTGIGLAIAKKSAERMGGHVIVHSEEGKGTRFIVELEAA